MEIDSSKIYDNVGKFFPTKIVLRTRIPAKWQESESFLKQIWEKINNRITKGKISEDKDGKKWKDWKSMLYLIDVFVVQERSLDKTTMSFGSILVIITKIE